MTTLAYGAKEAQPFTYGNRPDAEIDPGDSGEHPRVLPTIEMRAREPLHVEELAGPALEPFPLAPSVQAKRDDEDTKPSLPAQPVPSPSGPKPSPWRAANPGRPGASRAVALPAIFVALGTLAAVMVGLALCGIALAWMASLSGVAYVALSLTGVYFLPVGIASLIASPTLRLA